jgi:probable HAF family extracellular repeat protein
MRFDVSNSVVAVLIFSSLVMPVSVAAQDNSSKDQKSKHQQYKLVDLGTFGGPASFVNPVGNGAGTISSRGTAVGAESTSIPSAPNSNGFVCGGLDGTVPFVFHAFKWQGGVLTDLGALPPAADNCSDALSVNTSGEIVGTSENGLIDPFRGIKEIRAVHWKDGDIKDLGTLGGKYSAAGQINNRGQVVGFALNVIPDPFSMFATVVGGPSGGTQTRAFLWQSGQMQDLGSLGGDDAWGIFVNARGQVAGYSYTNSTPNATTGFPTTDPFLWDNGRMIDLGSLGGTFGVPSALNNRGQVVGQSNLQGDQPGNVDPFLWDGGKLIDLYKDTIGGQPITANAINDAGEIVGFGVFSNGASDAYLWKDGAVTDLGTLVGDCFSQAFAINSAGQVVGQSFSCVSDTVRTFLWENGSMVDLNALIPPNSGFQLVEATAINDQGEIAGDAAPPGCPNSNDASCGHAFVLIPDGDCSNDCEARVAASQNTATPAPNSATMKQGNETFVSPLERFRSQMRRRYHTSGQPAVPGN